MALLIADEDVPIIESESDDAPLVNVEDVPLSIVCKPGHDGSSFE